MYRYDLPTHLGWIKFILERVLPINNVCVANKERIKEVLSNLIDVKFPKLNEPSEYYIMPRVRFHPSIERDHLLEIARETMKEKRPECQECWYLISSRGLRHPDVCRLYTVPCSIWTRWRSRRRTPLYNGAFDLIPPILDSTQKVKLEKLFDYYIFRSFEKELLYWNFYRMDK